MQCWPWAQVHRRKKITTAPYVEGGAATRVRAACLTYKLASSGQEECAALGDADRAVISREAALAIAAGACRPSR